MIQYRLKIALPGISPMIQALIRVAGNISLADFHHIIQIAMGWDNDCLHFFHIYGKDYGITYDGGIGFSDNPRTVFLDDFGFDVGDRFTYTYNFFSDWLNDIRIEAIDVGENTKLHIPFYLRVCSMSYEVIRLASDNLTYREKMKLAQYLIQSAIKVEEALNPVGRNAEEPIKNKVKKDSTKREKIGGDELLPYARERLEKSKPGKVQSLITLYLLCFNFREVLKIDRLIR